jgi:hypothetical protein
MTFSDGDSRKQGRERPSEELDSNLIGPEDPERGNPPQHKNRRKKEKQFEQQHSNSEDPNQCRS